MDKLNISITDFLDQKKFSVHTVVCTLNDEKIGYIQDIRFRANINGTMDIEMTFPGTFSRKSAEVTIKKLSELGVHINRK